MNGFYLVFLLFSFGVAALAFRFSIPLALKLGWVDHPTSRRRHLKPMPIVGGITIYACWLATGSLFLWMNPDYLVHAQSIAAVAGGIVALCLMGLYDDLKGITPKVKLLFEFVVAIAVIALSAEIREYCLIWQGRIGFVAWPLAAIWLVGVSNSVNLVDGLDGLAAGISSMICVSMAILAYWAGGVGTLSFLLVTLLAPALLAFLAKNWSPAKVFLGDNGSLPTGFLLGVAAISGPVESGSYMQVTGLILMLGYPILDMGLCTFRRLRLKSPIFKADRGHLHHRLLRMGLSVPHVVTLILSLTAYLQLCAFCVISFSQSLLAYSSSRWMLINSAFLVGVGFSLFCLIYFLRLLEVVRTSALSESFKVPFLARVVPEGPRFHRCLVAKIDLAPLFESGLFEEKSRIENVMRSLNFLVESMLQRQDSFYISKQTMHIVFVERSAEHNAKAQLAQLLKNKLESFQHLFGIQYSSGDLKVTFEAQDYLLEENFSGAGKAEFQDTAVRSNA